MLSFFPRDVLDEIWDLIESVSEGFPIYSSTVVLAFSIIVVHKNKPKLNICNGIILILGLISITFYNTYFFYIVITQYQEIFHDYKSLNSKDISRECFFTRHKQDSTLSTHMLVFLLL